MSWSILAGLPNPIIVDAAGTAGSGYVLKAYLPGTTTSTSLAIDSAGSSPQTSITANSDGIWEVSGNEVTPYIDRTCKWGIFANALDAATNTPFYMGPFDNTEATASSGNTVKPFATLAIAVASLSINSGDALNLKERTAGNGGGAMWDVVLASTVTPNTFNIVICTGLPTLALVLRVGQTADVKQFGALADGIGVTDDTAAFEATRDYCITNGVTMFAPDGLYWFVGDIDLWGVQKIIFNGSMTFDNTTDKIIIGGSTTGVPSSDIKMFETNGTIQVYGMNRGRLKFVAANTLWLYASDAVANRNTVSYCNFDWVNVDNLHLECQDTAGGVPWINENTFYCGRVRNTVLFDGTYPMNNNRFWSIVLESVTIDIQKGNSNQFHDVRLEGTVTFTFASGTFNNAFWQTWSNFANTMMWDVPVSTYNITNAGDNNRIIPVCYAYTEKESLALYDINNIGNNSTFEVSGVNADKISITRNAATFFDTGLLPATDKLWFNVFSGAAASFHIYLEVYNEDGVAITTEPTSGYKSSQGATIWDAAGFWWYNNPVSGGSFAINPNADAGVKYIRCWARTDNAATGDEHTAIRCEVVQPQENKYPVKNIAADASVIDVLSNQVTATSEATALDLIKFTSGTSTQSDACGVLAGTLEIALTAEKGSTEDAAMATVQIMATREDTGVIVITAGTPTMLSNGGSLQINAVTLATKAGATISEAILTIAIGTNQADPFDALNARARLTGIADFHINGTYLIAASKI